MNRVVLNEKDFEDLVTGGVVEKGDVRILLQDIGWHVMMQKIDKAVTKDLKKRREEE